MKKQNYPESQEILAEINKAKKILINLHRGPDPDSFSCAFALYYFLCSLNKQVNVVVTKTSELSDQLSSTYESSLVKFVDYKKFDFSKYDLFISPDSGSWQQIVDNTEIKIPDIPIIVVDHHESNEKFGKINLIDIKAVSCAQMIYLLFKDWNFPVDTQMANLLMMGIITDSGAFAFSNDSKVMKIAAELMDLGANKMEIITKLFRTKKYKEVKAWGQYLTNMELDKENKFIWMAINNKTYKKLGNLPNIGSVVSTMFASIVEESNFGIVMTEKEEGNLYISFRSRSNIDIAKLAEQFGGGGHKMAAGGIIKDMPFNKAVEKVLETAKKYASGVN